MLRLFFLLALPCSLLAFVPQQDRGKEGFQNLCASCHLPNKATAVAPSFQDIRRDYGTSWAIAFVHDGNRLRQQGDVRALYGHYRYGRKYCVYFPLLPRTDIVAI